MGDEDDGLADLDLSPPNGSPLRLPAAMSVRDALSAMLAADGTQALVVDTDDRELGTVTVKAIADLLSREAS